MKALIVAVAQDLIPVLAFAAALVWVARDRAGKVAVAGQAAVGLLLVGVGIWLAGRLHVDPRPFVQDPSSRRCSRMPPTTASRPTTVPPAACSPRWSPHTSGWSGRSSRQAPC